MIKTTILRVWHSFLGFFKKPFLESIYIYPILFPANIVLTVAAANLVNLSYAEIAQTTLIVCIVVGLIFFLLHRLIHDGHRAGFLVFLGTLWVTYFGVIVTLMKTYFGLPMNITQQLILLLLWSALIVFIGSPWVWRHVRKPGAITAYLNIFSIILIGFSLFRIQSYQSGQTDVAKYGNTFPALENLHPPTQLPDIYYIILDGYGQADMLSEVYNMDDPSFIDYLKGKGFYIADKSETNYIQTGLSLSSSMNFDYLPGFPENSRDGRPIFNFIQHNRLQTIVEDLGYTTYSFQTAYEPTNLTHTDHFYNSTKVARMQALISLLMMNSVASVGVELDLIKLPLTSFAEQQNVFINNMAELNRIAGLPGPKFVFLHILIPHPPFIFNQQGPVTPNEAYILNDADLFQGTKGQYIAGYKEQVDYLNQAMENSIDQVLRKSAQTPIIVIQGDHGPGAYFRQTIKDTCLRERFSILNAYLLPGIDKAKLYPSISPVNTFRLILSAYFGADLDLLPDQHYYSNFIQPYEFIPVDVDTSNPCPPP